LLIGKNSVLKDNSVKACLIPYWINYQLYCDIIYDLTAKQTSQLNEVTNGPGEGIELSDFAEK
jgi:hypothetical protein